MMRIHDANEIAWGSQSITVVTLARLNEDRVSPFKANLLLEMKSPGR